MAVCGQGREISHVVWTRDDRMTQMPRTWHPRIDNWGQCISRTFGQPKYTAKPTNPLPNQQHNTQSTAAPIPTKKRERKIDGR